MTLATLQSGHAWGTNTSWLPSTGMAISSSSKHLHPEVTVIALQPTMPLWHAWQPGVFWLISRFLTTRPARHRKKPSLSSENAIFQLVPPDMHHQNWAECAICTFKDNFLAILAGIDSTFPPYLWDLLLSQAELTLNFLHQAMLNPRISMWEFFQGSFDFNKTSLGPVGCRVLIHAKPATRQSWDFCTKPGFYISPDLDSYCCFKLVKTDTKSQVISDTIKFHHLYLSLPVP